MKLTLEAEKFIEKLNSPEKSEGLKILEINEFVNRNIVYQADNKLNEWQTPERTLEKQSGDCEDFAILKYHLAKRAGISLSKLKIAHVLCRFRGHHMVALYNNIVLDNLITYTRPMEECGDYTFIYAFNHYHTWVIKGLTFVPVKKSNLKQWNKICSKV